MHWALVVVLSTVVLLGATGVLVAVTGRGSAPPVSGAEGDPFAGGRRNPRRARTLALVVALVVSVVGSLVVLNPAAHAAGPAAQILATSGTPQSVTVGSTFAVLTATVEDATNAPVSGASVTFTAPSSPASGTFGGSSTFVTTSDSNGLATATFTANSVAGSYSVTATTGVLTPASFALTNTPGPAVKLVATGGNGQTIGAGAQAPTPLAATVEDASGNVVTSPAVTVTFAAPSTTGPSGTFAGSTSVTTVNGVATAPAFTANTITGGPYPVTATSPGLTQASFSLTNGPGATAKLGSLVGNFQSAHIGSPFAVPLSVTAYDAYGHAVPGLSVTFAAPTGGAGGTFAGSSNTFTGSTNALGVVTAPTITANGTPGIYTVNVTGGGASTAFALANYTIPGAPGILTASAEDASAKVRWSAPASNGFGAITGYLIVASNGARLQVGDVKSALFPGLVNGDPYSFTVAAINAAGAGPFSGVSNTVTPVNNGYWMVASDGGIFSFGTHPFYGSTGALHLNRPIVGMAATPDDGGYWLVASDGGIFAFGDAHFYGSTGSLHLAAPIVGMTPTPDGRGYWLVASDGGIFAFGDARFHGSTGGKHLAAPIVGMASTGQGAGYWLVASDGGIFAFGSARFSGSTGAVHLNRPIVGMAPTNDSHGYWLVASDGGIFAFGDAQFYGSTGGRGSTGPSWVSRPLRSGTGTGWWPRTVGCSPSGTRHSPDRPVRCI